MADSFKWLGSETLNLQMSGSSPASVNFVPSILRMLASLAMQVLILFHRMHSHFVRTADYSVIGS